MRIDLPHLILDTFKDIIKFRHSPKTPCFLNFIFSFYSMGIPMVFWMNIYNNFRKIISSFFNRKYSKVTLFEYPVTFNIPDTKVYCVSLKTVQSYGEQIDHHY